ncbi:metallothionein [Pseudomonas berkeleyensis]|uniref:Metallothionein n=1 Tax=Pseudomonas berkeleyensis TaxID=2726956 RepID=A0A7G5DH04_9PSED|nr:metallothionein [Pseudomonas berkeleyensis]QMV61029.1 metallothionein [Pseudomonas berkeleyensis]WSO36455.1 metallothionein [Pseudomonas berkeleyensis]
MSEERTCACPYCDCLVESQTWVQDAVGDGLAYCCEACQQGHPNGMIECQHAGCDCGERLALERTQES